MGACYQLSLRILVRIFEYFGSQKSSIIHHPHVWSLLDTFWYIYFVIAFCRTFPPLTSKLCWLYSVPFAQYLLSSYPPDLPFFSLFLFTIIATIPFSLALAPFLPFCCVIIVYIFIEMARLFWTSAVD